MAAADRFEIVDRRPRRARRARLPDRRPGHRGGHLITAAAEHRVAQRATRWIRRCCRIGSLQAGNLGAMSVVRARRALVGTVRTFRKSRAGAQVESAPEPAVPRRSPRASARPRRSSTSACSRPPSTRRSVPCWWATSRPSLSRRERGARHGAQSMGSEDFSFMLQTKPGAYFRLGQGGAEDGCVLRSSRFDFNDAVIPLGSAMLTAPGRARHASCRMIIQ